MQAPVDLGAEARVLLPDPLRVRAELPPRGRVAARQRVQVRERVHVAPRDRACRDPEHARGLAREALELRAAPPGGGDLETHGDRGADQNNMTYREKYFLNPIQMPKIL